MLDVELEAEVDALMKEARVVGLAIAVIASGPDCALTTRMFNCGVAAKDHGAPVTSLTHLRD